MEYRESERPRPKTLGPLPAGGQNLGAGLTQQADDELARIVRDYQAALASEFERRYNDFDRLIDLRMQPGKQAPERPRPKGLPATSVHRLRETLKPGYSSVAPTELKPDDEQPVVTIEQTLAHSPRLALLGAPGAGKSTTLRRLLKQFDPATASQPATKIPLLVELNRWQDPALSLLDFLIAQIALYSPELAKSLPGLLQQGRVLLLLDALNEVPQLKRDEKTNAVDDPRATEIASFAKKYSQCQVVLTCRVKEFDGIPGWHYLHVLDLNKKQVSEFVEVFFEGVADGPAQGQKLLAELYESQNKRKQKLQGLTRQPFYLVRLLAYYCESGDLPDNPALLLKFSVDEALEREFTRLIIAHELTEEVARQERAQLESALALLAFNMTEAGQVGAVEQGRVAVWLFHLRDERPYEQRYGDEKYREWQAEKAAAGARVRHAQGAGLLMETGGQFGFYHQLMQEYFCACFCFSCELDQKWLVRTTDYQLAEVWRLWGGLDPALVAKLAVYLRDPESVMLRSSAAEALGELGDRRAVIPLIDALHNPEYFVRFIAAEALVYLGDSRALPELKRVAQEDEGVTEWGRRVADRAKQAIAWIKGRQAWQAKEADK